jgi:hypothetical protein
MGRSLREPAGSTWKWDSEPMFLIDGVRSPKKGPKGKSLAAFCRAVDI